MNWSEHVLFFFTPVTFKTEPESLAANARPRDPGPVPAEDPRFLAVKALKDAAVER